MTQSYSPPVCSCCMPPRAGSAISPQPTHAHPGRVASLTTHTQSYSCGLCPLGTLAGMWYLTNCTLYVHCMCFSQMAGSTAPLAGPVGKNCDADQVAETTTQRGLSECEGDVSSQLLNKLKPPLPIHTHTHTHNTTDYHLSFLTGICRCIYRLTSCFFFVLQDVHVVWHWFENSRWCSYSSENSQQIEQAYQDNENNIR